MPRKEALVSVLRAIMSYMVKVIIHPLMFNFWELTHVPRLILAMLAKETVIAILTAKLA